MDAALKEIGRLYVLPYYRPLDALARHLDDCQDCASPARPDCPEGADFVGTCEAGAALTTALRAAKAAQTEAARWN